MPRLLPTLCALATTCGIAAGITPAPEAAQERSTQVVGRERPLFLGSTVVIASALPNKR